MENKTYRVFDAEQLYETEIVPVVDQLNSPFLHYNFPYFFAAAIRSDETGTDYHYECHDIQRAATAFLACRRGTSP